MQEIYWSESNNLLRNWLIKLCRCLILLKIMWFRSLSSMVLTLIFWENWVRNITNMSRIVWRLEKSVKRMWRLLWLIWGWLLVWHRRRKNLCWVFWRKSSKEILWNVPNGSTGYQCTRDYLWLSLRTRSTLMICYKCSKGCTWLPWNLCRGWRCWRRCWTW